MQHPAELSLHSYMNKALKGNATVSTTTVQQVANDVADAVKRQFGGEKRGKFKLRMSNVGKPTCQLWFEKNKPETALPRPSNFLMNMMIGDIVEAVFKGLLTEAGVKYDNSDSVILKVKDKEISGTYDLAINDAIDDVKSASDWSYKYKFESFDSLKNGDTFGYIGQLAGYAKASNKKAGGWWVINKANGKIKYISAEGIDINKEISYIEDTVKTLEKNEFKRCFNFEDEMFYGKPTGNKILNKICGFCEYRFACWKTLEEKPSMVSKAKEPKIMPYIRLEGETV